jgi:hypothetical protein
MENVSLEAMADPLLQCHGGHWCLVEFFTSPESVQHICLVVMAVGVSWRPLHHCHCALICFHATSTRSPVACKLRGSGLPWLMSIERLFGGWWTFQSSEKDTSLNASAWGRGINKNHNGSQC